MKLKTITLIVAIVCAIATILSTYNFINFLSLASDYVTAQNFVNQGVYIIQDMALCLFFFILYKNQK